MRCPVRISVMFSIIWLAEWNKARRHKLCGCQHVSLLPSSMNKSKDFILDQQLSGGMRRKEKNFLLF
jgi:hypothetical protein